VADPKWTVEHLRTAYCMGWRDRGLAEDALAVFDDAAVAVIAPPRISYEQRVAARVSDMEQHAAGARDRLRAQAERNREHDRRVLALAGVSR
jgi:hypothetical protein